jgi:phage shock protein PspC (stress-responsive transcriptional regulator)/tRNA A-37 threonylcarbamoyl transferase component Bud32
LGTSPCQGPFIAPSPAELAAQFPQLEILQLLGQGGMGAVYKARQKKLDRLVALKILPFESARDPAFAERFQREARALARLNHPNIVAVHDFGESNELFYFIMEYVDGVNLRQLLQTGKLQPDDALRIVPQICDALQYAHDEEIVHRDIKPENILLDKRGRVKIADFGLAKILSRATPSYTLTGSQQVMGTPHYMAPEQMERPGSVDHRADIYSLGVVCYEMLTGELPLGRFALPSEKTSVDGRLDEIVLRTLEKDPDRRYQRAIEVKTDLEAAAGALAPPAPGVGSVQSFQNEVDLEMRRLQLVGPATGLVVVAILGIVHWAIPLVLELVDDWHYGRTPMAGFWATVGILGPVVVISASLVLVGSRKMLRFERYEFVVFACVWAMLPWSGLVTILGLLIGIWALQTVLRPDVKLAFVRHKVQARLSGARPALPTRRLQRSSSDRVLAGVCGGIGNFLGMNPMLVRILYVVLCLLTGLVLGLVRLDVLEDLAMHQWGAVLGPAALVVVYLVLAVLLPSDAALVTPLSPPSWSQAVPPRLRSPEKIRGFLLSVFSAFASRPAINLEAIAPRGLQPQEPSPTTTPAIVRATQAPVEAMPAPRRPAESEPVPAAGGIAKRRRWPRVTALILLFSLAVLGTWFTSPLARYIGNHGDLELVPQPGLTSMIVLQNDAMVTDWLDMRTSHSISLSPGKYRLNPGCKPGFEYEWMRWEVATSGLLSGTVVHHAGTSCEVEIRRGERVVVHASPRPSPPMKLKQDG